MQSKGKTAEARKKTDTSDVVFFQNRLQDKIQLFEKEKEMESGVMDKVELFSFSPPHLFLWYFSKVCQTNQPHSFKSILPIRNFHFCVMFTVKGIKIMIISL